VLDAIDGRIARWTGTVSEFGARFDMEVDAFLILVLSVYAATSLGWWVLTIGAMRYVFVAMMWILPWMRRTVPPRYWCKVVAAIQGVVLIVAAGNILPRPLTVIAVSGALILLVESFGRETVWLWRQAPSRPMTRTGPQPAQHPKSAARQ
jgi:phosphatidylglycerophosphate synthase